MASALHAIRDAIIERESLAIYVHRKVYVGRVPQGVETPYITLRKISALHEYDLAGEIDILQSVIQVDVWTDTPTMRETLADAVRLLLSGKRGNLGSEDNQGGQVFVCASTIERDDDFEERPVDASDEWTFRTSMDFRLTHHSTRAPE